jgi:hypothetical protein
LTSNATYLNYVVALSARQLVEVHPLRPKAGPVRRLIVKPDIDPLLQGADVKSGFPHYQADHVVGKYVAGQLVTVSLIGNSKAEPDMERLEDLDEVWALCFRLPRPGWRLIGRFLQRDLFISLRAYDRHFLGKREKYHKHAAEIIDDWKTILGDLEPLRGTSVNDYLSGVWRDVDQKT